MCPRNQIAAGFESEVFWCSTINKNVDWINYCCRNLKLKNGILRQCSRNQGFIMPEQTQWTRIQGWDSRTKRSHLIYPFKQVTRAKSKTQPKYGCMWLYWLFHFPSAMWPASCFSSLSFISALPSLPSASLSEHSLSASLLALLPAIL
jgi:hypothetical protein